MPEIADLLEMVVNPSLHSFWFTVGSSGSFLFCFMEVHPKSREDVNLDSLIRQSRWSTAVASPLA